MLPVLGYCAATIPVYCKNGGVCYDHLEFGKRCKCAAGFVGMRCELIRKCNYRQHMLEEMYLRNIIIFKKVYPHKYIYIIIQYIHINIYIYLYMLPQKGDFLHYPSTSQIPLHVVVFLGCKFTHIEAGPDVAWCVSALPTNIPCDCTPVSMHIPYIGRSTLMKIADCFHNDASSEGSTSNMHTSHRKRWRCSQGRNSAAHRASTWGPAPEETLRAQTALHSTLTSRPAWSHPAHSGAIVTTNRTTCSSREPTDTSHSWSRSSSYNANTEMTTRGPDTDSAAQVGWRVYHLYNLSIGDYYYRRAVFKIWEISSRAAAIRQRSWRRFFCAYMLPIRDLCATAFCVLLSFVFYGKIIISPPTRCLRCATEGSV